LFTFLSIDYYNCNYNY